MTSRKRPERFLIGVGSLLASAGLLTSCHGSSPSSKTNSSEKSQQATINVKRTRYDNVAECARQWPDVDDCRLVVSVPTSSSLNEAARSAAPSDVSAPITVELDENGVMRVDSLATEDRTGWYGPYYTTDGAVYHASGLAGIGAVPHHVSDDTSNITVRDCALQSGYGAFDRTPQAEAQEEAHVISRGGLLCPQSTIASSTGGGAGGGGAHGGWLAGGGHTGGNSWFHGGGEGGGHGGGGHGSGGG